MRNILFVSFLSAAVALPSAALAQEKAKSVDDYLCAFAGKCGGEAASPEVTKDAPETKGFTLTRPTAAPRTSTQARGFALTKPVAAPSGNAAAKPMAAPATKVASKPAAKKPVAVASKSKTIPQPAMAQKRGDLSLNFELGSANLTPTARGNAKAFAEALMRPELATRKIMIEGHTDAIGSRESNLDLSQRRAQAVADFLTQNGVSAERLEVKGYGFDQPLPGLAKTSPDNRRVEAVITS